MLYLNEDEYDAFGRRSIVRARRKSKMLPTWRSDRDGIILPQGWCTTQYRCYINMAPDWSIHNSVFSDTRVKEANENPPCLDLNIFINFPKGIWSTVYWTSAFVGSRRVSIWNWWVFFFSFIIWSRFQHF